METLTNQYLGGDSSLNGDLLHRMLDVDTVIGTFIVRTIIGVVTLIVAMIVAKILNMNISK